MISCIIGTRAQLIKMAPVILEMERREFPFSLLFTGQHIETMGQIIRDFGIRTVGIHLYEGREITGVAQMARWFPRCLISCIKELKKLMPPEARRRYVVLVHGDTLSTLLGAIAGRRVGADVAHIEAGLRSNNIFHPFPEELTRLAIFRLSNLAFCPGNWSYANMQPYSTRRINTGHNTLIDALSIALAMTHHIELPFPPMSYGIASIHRFENIFNQRRLAEIIELLELTAAHHPLAFVLHPATSKRLSQCGLLTQLENNSNIRMLPRMGYVDFVSLMQNSKFVITDGGGNQEELSYLGIPTLLMRKATERREGMDSTVTLCGYDKKILQTFLSSLKNVDRKPWHAPDTSPSKLIVDELMASLQDYSSSPYT